jgi:hypothetical protein
MAVPVPVPVPVPDLVGVGRQLRWEVEMESDCPLDSVVEDSYWTEIPVVDFWKSINGLVNHRQDLGLGLGLFTVLSKIADNRKPSSVKAPFPFRCPADATMDHAWERRAMRLANLDSYRYATCDM